MLSHPWTELHLLIKEKWLTQKAFSAILWKKVSELNELLKWKRNITIQRDYLLHQTLWTPIKYRILKQVDYDYSLLDTNMFPLFKGGDGIAEGDFSQLPTNHSDLSEESFLPWQGEVAKPEGVINTHPSSWATAKDLMWKSKEQNTQDSSPSLHSSSEWQNEPDQKNDEDLKNRVQIFRNF